ncbi:TVP38/TMEM64 family protein [Geosporobacter ferrireducens]|uniref:TVP38/TMEM64 family protein n=1 Tax=Geosporobacter ferrireducens TaxID=1424294 RepID=UPI00139E4965|nr:TVP38/TMEM64 family protein [Geosporobacter ferrireducens]MTI53508.1 TVP38/TMEM64 family protein [Geosporobacter ferrireducens]
MKSIKKYDKTGWILLFIIAASLVLSQIRLVDWITLENLQQNKELLKDYVAQHYVISATGYVLLYILVAATAIPGAILLSLTGGFLFGVLPAMIYVNIGATGGAVFCFLMARYLGKEWVYKKYGKKISKLNRELEEYGKNYLLTIRFIPILPFFLINILAGVTNVSAKTFFWTTALGGLPGSIIYTIAGKNLGGIQSTKDLFSPKIIAFFLMLAAFSLLPILIKKKKKKKFHQ